MIHIKVQDDAHRPIAELAIEANGDTMRITGGWRRAGAGQLEPVDVEVADPKVTWHRVLKAVLSVDTAPTEVRAWLRPPKTKMCVRKHVLVGDNRVPVGKRIRCRQCLVLAAQAKVTKAQREVDRLRAGGG